MKPSDDEGNSACNRHAKRNHQLTDIDFIPQSSKLESITAQDEG